VAALSPPTQEQGCAPSVPGSGLPSRRSPPGHRDR
jgi:hypothetical protein